MILFGKNLVSNNNIKALKKKNQAQLVFFAENKKGNLMHILVGNEMFFIGSPTLYSIVPWHVVAGGGVIIKMFCILIN